MILWTCIGMLLCTFSTPWYGGICFDLITQYNKSWGTVQCSVLNCGANQTVNTRFHSGMKYWRKTSELNLRQDCSFLTPGTERVICGKHLKPKYFYGWNFKYKTASWSPSSPPSTWMSCSWGSTARWYRWWVLTVLVKIVIKLMDNLIKM